MQQAFRHRLNKLCTMHMHDVTITERKCLKMVTTTVRVEVPPYIL